MLRPAVVPARPPRVEDRPAEYGVVVEKDTMIAVRDGTRLAADVYRPAVPVEILDNPAEISGEPLLKGFVLNLADIFD